jgi:hypothetical protein
MVEEGRGFCVRLLGSHREECEENSSLYMVLIYNNTFCAIYYILVVVMEGSRDEVGCLTRYVCHIRVLYYSYRISQLGRG